MNSNDIVKAALGDKKAFQSNLSRLDKIEQDQERVLKTLDEINKIMNNLKV